MSKRILADIKQINEQETKNLRIFYAPNSENAMKGLALIFGPGGSPYEDLPIFLDIQYPSDYPFSSPKVRFLTYDGETRFHPNLYIEGKVCLSILGTWQGPSWTSVMNLRTVLLSILGLLDNEPLLHEPGYATSKGALVSTTYTEFIEFKSLKYIVNCILGAILWVGGVTVLGYLAGNIPFVKTNFEVVIFGIIGISVLPIIIEIIRAKMKQKNKNSEIIDSK
jgi:ubiquitin-conjugating enzyme E2 Z